MREDLEKIKKEIQNFYDKYNTPINLAYDTVCNKVYVSVNIKI